VSHHHKKGESACHISENAQSAGLGKKFHMGENQK